MKVATRSPLWLRLLYALVFWSFAGLALVVAYPEALQLAWALRGPFHSGTPPSPLALAAGALALAGAVAIGANLFRQSASPLRQSALVMMAFALAGASRAAAPPSRRSWQGGSLEILESARALHLQMTQRLQRDAQVPGERSDWQAVLARSVREPLSPVRARTFARLPYTVLRIDRPGQLPSPLVPASFLVWVSEDGVGYQLTPVGLAEDGKATPLQDDRGNPVVLKGVFNPDLPR